MTKKESELINIAKEANKKMRFIKILILVFLIQISFASAKIIADIDIPISYLSIKPGETIYANLKIFRISDEDERIEYTIKAYVLDENNNKILEKIKDVAIEKELTTTISFYMPQSTKPGEYKINVHFDGKEASAAFIVEGEKKPESEKYLYSIILLILIIIILLITFQIVKLYKIEESEKIDAKEFVK